MALKFNPFTGNLDFAGSGGGGGGARIDGRVASPAALPITLGTPAVDSVYLCESSSGVWLVNYKPAGLWRRIANDGELTDWSYMGPFDGKFADDVEVTDPNKGLILHDGTDRYRMTVRDGQPVFTLLTLLMLAATGFAQTRGLVVDASNNVRSGTNATLTWSNALSWDTNSAAQTRTNLGLGYLGTNAATTVSNLFSGGNSLPSGAAAAGSTLQADGSGGSAFVASKTVQQVTSSNFSKVNWTTNAIQQNGNINSSPFPAWTLVAGKFYEVNYAVRFESTATNGPPTHGFVIATNAGFANVVQAGQGINSIGSVNVISSSTNTDQAWFLFPSATATNARTLTGRFIFYAIESTTAVYSWCPSANVTNAWTLSAPSMVRVTEL